MGVLKLSTVQTADGTSNITIDSSTGKVSFPSGLEPTIINRGSTTTQLELSSFNEIHFYSTTSNSLYLPTLLLENAWYEFTYTASGGSNNIDFVLQPNNSTYSGEFQSLYRATQGGNGSFDKANQNNSQIYFDHQYGGGGGSPVGRLTLYTGPVGKTSFYFGGDDGANLCTGYNRWTNDSRKWEELGFLTFNGNNKKCWVRRIG